MKFFYLVIVFILFSFCAQSQQQTGILKGVVKDGSTKEVIPGATIQLATNLAKGTVTDIEGV